LTLERFANAKVEFSAIVTDRNISALLSFRLVTVLVVLEQAWGPAVVYHRMLINNENIHVNK
jgi:hypothetical protein